MATADDRPTRQDQCDVCGHITDTFIYPPDEFKRVVARGLLPPKDYRWFLAAQARPAKRDAFGNEIVVISTDLDAVRKSVTRAEERATLEQWRIKAQQRETEALLCSTCDEAVRKLDKPGVLGRIVKLFRS